MSEKKKTIARVNFTIRRPRDNGSGRGSFHFRKEVRFHDAKPEQKAFKFPPKNGKPDDRLDKINEAYHQSKIDYETANKMAEALREQLYKEHGLVKTKVFSEVNYKALNDFFTAKYSSRKTKDRDGAFNDYRRAIDSIGLLSIHIATAQQIEDALKEIPNNKQRRLISRLTRILKFIGRDLELQKDKKSTVEIRYLTEKEFPDLMKSVPNVDHLRLVYSLMFHSGCRLGEIFALDNDDYKNGILNVNKQMLRPYQAMKRKLFKMVDGKKVLDLIQPTKNEQKRRVVVFPEFEGFFEEWCKVDLDKRKEFRTLRFAEILRTACEKQFPNRPIKHCVAHDLRHSFAIRNLHQDVNLTYVAQQLGNRIEVCQEYYTGYTLNDETIEILKLKLQKKKRRAS
jgi:integrase